MQISKRLRAVAAMVSPGSRLADIGTDHGYVPIFLVLENKIRSAVAMDINRGPLERARLHIGQRGLEARIETRLSDGLEKLRPGEADSILIAGMGGMLTIKILKNGQESVRLARELILQPQSDIREVRLFLRESGWQIEAENMVEEDGKFYPMMRAVRETKAKESAVRDGGVGSGAEAEELALRYGPVLLEQRHPALLRYLERERAQLEAVREKLSGGQGPVWRLEEIEGDLRLNEAAQSLYYGAEGRTE